MLQLTTPRQTPDTLLSHAALPDTAATRKLQLRPSIALGCVTYVTALVGSLLLKTEASILDSAPLWLGLTAILWIWARRHFGSPGRATLALEATAMIAVLGLSLACLSYMAMMTDLPLRDAELVWVDRHLGFDWLRMMRQLDSFPRLISLLDFAYKTFTPQIIGTVLLFVLANQGLELDRFLITLVCASVFAEAASLVAPTLGPMSVLAHDVTFANLPTLGRTTSEIVLALRKGALRSIDLQAIDGIISFPSLHAAIAIIVPFTWRRNVVIFLPVVMLDVLMLASAIPSGNHYLSDVVGGVAVAVLAIACAPPVQQGFEFLIGSIERYVAFSISIR